MRCASRQLAICRLNSAGCFSPGYLQEEGLSATSQAFIHESPNLKEYADHTSGDGAVPACVFVSLAPHLSAEIILDSIKFDLAVYCWVVVLVVFVPSQSIFGNGLTTILNEYVATKAKGEVFRWRSLPGEPYCNILSICPQSLITRYRL